jgi:predicted ATPase
MATLDGIIISGFKSIASAAVKLRSLNVLIGANGSGKSNFVGAFSFLRAVNRGQLQDYVGRVGGAERVLHFGSRVTSELEMRMSFGRGRAGYGITLARNDADELYMVTTGHHPPEGGAEAIRWAEGGDHPLPPEHVSELIKGWQLHHFHDTSAVSPLKSTADVGDNRRLGPDGANLAAFLYLLRQRHEGSYNEIRRTVQLVAPFFDDFLLKPTALNESRIRLEWRHRGSDAYFDVSALSDGSLRFIALATLLLQPVELRPSLIMLDEPELGLHPYAIATLASLIRRASAETQLVLATQSSLLLDHFRPEDVLVTERAEGRSTFSRLDGAALETWLEDYSLGQLWEKNHFGGRPAREAGEDGRAK